MPIRFTPLFAVLATCFASFPTLAADPSVDVDEGREIFTKKAEPACAVCHTLADADSSGAIGPNLDELKPSADRVAAAVKSGIGIMPAFADSLTADEIATVSAYVAEVAGKK